MEKVFGFLDGGTMLLLPVTPKRYTWGTGKSIETVNISEVGDVSLAGKPRRYSGRIECMFPAVLYPWTTPGAVPDPYYYVDRFRDWAGSKKVLRFIVGGTQVNSQVLVENIQYSEQDASGDVYAVIDLREWVDLEAATVSNLDTSTGSGGTQNSGQAQEQSAQRQQYTIVSGDMLSVLCRRFYGSGTAEDYNALAKYNGIANPHLIYPGTTITIPPADELLGR